MFPKILPRVPYLVRWLCLVGGYGLIAVLLVTLRDVVKNYDLLVAGLVGLAVLGLIFKLAALDLPRTRSIGWSPWILLIYLVPGIGALVIQILLFVMPPKRI